MILFEVLYLALPAFAANMAPVIATRLDVLPFLAKPIDGGYLLNGKPLLGKNKMWRGVVAAIVASLIVVLIQYFIQAPVTHVTVVYESIWLALTYGIWVGILVMVGDALGSVIKRQCGFTSGQPLIPLDQIDYIVLFIVGTIPFLAWTPLSASVLIGVTFFLNLAANAAAYAIGIKKTYW
ncbi:CDP-archaeol synthase [Candidatus Kaiserbacteria bacterium]|nr:MAG: CDP-archaeol synthase [Candidatus Kaiserbacteria bacterium]